MATGDLTVTEAEHQFLKAFVTILEHLKNRATKAERENVNLRQELTALREKVEYLTEIAAPAGYRMATEEENQLARDQLRNGIAAAQVAHTKAE